MKDSLSVKGNLKIFKNGILIGEEKNLVVNNGLNVIAERLAGTAKAAVSHMGIGTGTTAATATDTGLEIPKSVRVAATTIVVANGTVTITATFTGAAHAGAITEAALFNDVSLGQMISRVVFAAYTIGSSDALTITWTLTFANA